MSGYFYIKDSRGNTGSIGLISDNGTLSGDFAVAWVATNNPTKEDILLFLDRARQYILSNALPAGTTGVGLPSN